MIITPTELIERSNAIRGFPIKPIEDICNLHVLEDHDEVKHYNADKITEWLKPYCNLSSFILYNMNSNSVQIMNILSI